MKIRLILLGASIALALLLWGWSARPQPETEAEQTEKTPAPESAFQVGDRLTPAVEAGDQGSGRLPPAVDGSTEILELGWGDLIPAGWITDELLERLNVEDLEDDDPRAEEALQRIREEWDRAPVVEELNGQRVRIPGFVVPLEGDGKTIGEFLLVPYFGACVHVPPPPSNQLIHVLPDQPIPGEWDMAPVWVVGELTVTRFDSSLGSAGYQLHRVGVEEYQEEPPE